MSEYEVGPIGHMLQEVGAGNPGATHLLEELAQAKRRLREYEGMMTRREVLEEIVRVGCDSERSAWDQAYFMGMASVLGIGGLPSWTHIHAAHELALMMNAEREEAKP